MTSETPPPTPDGAPCPPAAELWAAARGELDPLTTLRLDEHAQQCESCAEAWRLGKFLAVDLAPLEMNRLQSSDQGPPIGRAWLWLAILVLVAAIAFFVLWLALPK